MEPDAGVACSFGTTTMTKNKDTVPFSLRLTREERQRLEEQAAGMSLAAFVRARLFGKDEAPRQTCGKTPVKDHRALAQLLGTLGQSRMAQSLGQLARAAQSGSLPMTPETEVALCAAYREVVAMKRLLMTALGIRER